MMRTDRGEEADMLLSAYQQTAQQDAFNMRQRRRAIRTVFAVVGIAALMVGCIAFALNGAENGVATMSLDFTTGDADDEAVAMESQFGWNSIGYGWCSVKSSTWCMFSKDKQKCKKNLNCYNNQEKASASDGNGSGSEDFGNVTVGDSSTDVEVGAWTPTAPEETPTEKEKETKETKKTSSEEKPLAETSAHKTSSQQEASAEEGTDVGGED